IDHADGDYADEPMIYQAFQPLPRFGDSYTLIGSWIIDDEAAGMCLPGHGVSLLQWR
ncbi:glutathionylspermidine synthase family protein, partial [Salmonella enterica subsp. enterica serovar Give]|nr:glutathionylspermidine synthase family protein [Salmonella enterica subsp. enterica serovar Give]